MYEQSGEITLQEISHKKTCLKKRVEAEIEQAGVDFAIEQPAYGHLRVSHQLNLLCCFGSSGGVRSIWLRHDLESSAKRLKALEAKAAQDNLILHDYGTAFFVRHRTYLGRGCRIYSGGYSSGISNLSSLFFRNSPFDTRSRH